MIKSSEPGALTSSEVTLGSTTLNFKAIRVATLPGNPVETYTVRCVPFGEEWRGVTLHMGGLWLGLGVGLLQHLALHGLLYSVLHLCCRCKMHGSV